MEDHAQLITQITLSIPTGVVSQFRHEYLSHQAQLQDQAPLVQRYLEINAASLAEAVVQGLMQVRFSLPDQVAIRDHDSDVNTLPVPAESREQMIGGLMDRLIRTDLRTALRTRFLELEASMNQALSMSAILLRHAVVLHLVHNMLPSGNTVQYELEEGEEIPTIPVSIKAMSGSAITEMSYGGTKGDAHAETRRGELSVPYVEAARRFYLPQWVAFDNDLSLLVGSISEAEAVIASMQRYLSVLHAAVGLTPYMVADKEYQQKRYGILGQLVNQGRALAHYQVMEIVQTIQRRAASHDLDRGLSLSLPYFNDQTLKKEEYNFDVIPAGRVMFVPAFVVLAVRAQGAKVAQDTRMSQSTRRHLLAELGLLEQIFSR